MHKNQSFDFIQQKVASRFICLTVHVKMIKISDCNVFRGPLRTLELLVNNTSLARKKTGSKLKLKNRLYNNENFIGF